MGLLLSCQPLVRAGVLVATSLISLSPVIAQDAINPHPANPAELLAALDRADKLEIFTSVVVIGGPVQAPVYTSSNPKDISELKRALVFEPAKAWFRSACLPELDIQLSRKGKELGVISVFDDLTIEFSGWTDDARISNRENILAWFDARGISQPRVQIESDEALEKAVEAVSQRWLAAMPPGLRPLWPGILENEQWWSAPSEAPKSSARILEPVLTDEYPDAGRRIRALFSWFGSVGGPWTGYEAWEDVAAEMLLAYSGPQLVEALQAEPLTDAEAEGAARFFVGCVPGASFRPPDDFSLISQLPGDLKGVLLNHVLKSNDPDKISRARSAFQSSPN